MEGSSSRSGRDRGAAVEADAISGWKGAAVKVDVIGEQQLKRTQSGSSSLEADAVGEH